MSVPTHNAILRPRQSDIDCVESNSDKPSQEDFERVARRDMPELDLDTDIFEGAALRGLVDDWLAPMIVESLLHESRNLKRE
jgi:hypothetical protein